MEIRNIENYRENGRGTAVALGNFDGVHIGHKALIEEMLRTAKDLGLKSSVLLFNNHTKKVLLGNGPKLLTSKEQKYKIMEELGVEIIYSMEFNKEVMKLSPREFVEKILIRRMNCKSVVIGSDYRFGHKASGNADLLKELGKEYGFNVTVLEPIYVRDEIVSSTKIREFLSKGELEKAKAYLGRDYSIVGKVVSGKKIGNKMGYPTANIEPIEDYIIPLNGVYGTISIVGGKKYLSATSVGFNPTFGEKSIKIESHILDFQEDIYGFEVELIFIEYLREELKFNTTKELIEQIDKDIEKIKKL